MGKKMTVSEIAERYGISRTAVNQWIHKGLKATKINKVGQRPYFLIDEKDLDAYLKNRGIK